ncbi:terpene synthase family protein [Streptomyces sp. NPDC014861]|uniref:terpene synthase family protein n=1 Tax=Streptomyces sp. NPDC014861 TaxID=3364923 RepID=UPI003701EE88
MRGILEYRIPNLTEGLSPVRSHDLAESVIDYTVDRLLQMVGQVLPAELAESFARNGTAIFTSYCWPDALPDRLRTLSVMNAFAFFADDMGSNAYGDVLGAEASKSWVIEYIHACMGKREKLTTSWGNETADAWEELSSFKPEITSALMRKAWLTWMATYAPAPPSEFSEADRYANAGGPVTLPMTAFCLGLDVSAPMEDPVFRQTVEDATLLSILINDVISLGGEIINRDESRNAIIMIMRERQIPLQQAVDRICGRIVQLRNRFLSQRSAVLASSVGKLEGAASYLEAFESVITGVAFYHATSKRYRFSPQSTWEGSGAAVIKVYEDSVLATALPA